MVWRASTPCVPCRAAHPDANKDPHMHIYESTARTRASARAAVQAGSCLCPTTRADGQHSVRCTCHGTPTPTGRMVPSAAGKGNLIATLHLKPYSAQAALFFLRAAREMATKPVLIALTDRRAPQLLHCAGRGAACVGGVYAAGSGRQLGDSWFPATMPAILCGGNLRSTCMK